MKHSNKTITLTLCALSAFSAHGAQMQKFKTHSINLLAQPAYLLLGGSLVCSIFAYRNYSRSIYLYNASQEQILHANSQHQVGEKDNPNVLNTMARLGENHSKLAEIRANKYRLAAGILLILGALSAYTNFSFTQNK